MRIGILLVLIVMLASPASAKDEFGRPPLIIDATNIGQLQSVKVIDFSGVLNDLGKFDIGWFVLSDNGNYVATYNHSQDVFLLDTLGNVVEKYSILGEEGLKAEFIDARFVAGLNEIVSLHFDGKDYLVVHSFAASKYPIETAKLPSLSGTPLNIWSEMNESFHPPDYAIFLELASNSSNSPRKTVSLSAGCCSPFRFLSGSPDGAPIVSEFTAPESDLDALVRIGRVPPPFAVTSSADGVVKRWNLQTGDVTAQAKVEDGPVVFGQINASGSHLVWRDPESKSLHLLNFETGEDKIVAPLDGQYIQFMFLTVNADVIIGVNIDLQPIVVAWDVTTGRRYDLGEYRQCSRVPDMARLSKDGTTVVIGCDTGLDIWRVVED
jgi:WD40 repeat protein